MTREIKFRAWDKKENKMKSMSASSAEIATSYRNESEYEVMQYTGLKDKSGKEIYEGDVVEFAIADEDGQAIDAGMGEVRFIHLAWKLYYANPKDHSHDKPDLLFSVQAPEVVGNVWENPELLKP